MKELAGGETVGGRYQVVQEIGRGGMQVVYLVSCPTNAFNIMSCLCHPLLAGGCDGTSDLGT